MLSSPESYFEVELVNRLQSMVDKQRGQIKKFEQSNIEYKSDNEEVISSWKIQIFQNNSKIW